MPSRRYKTRLARGGGESDKEEENSCEVETKNVVGISVVRGGEEEEEEEEETGHKQSPVPANVHGSPSQGSSFSHEEPPAGDDKNIMEGFKRPMKNIKICPHCKDSCRTKLDVYRHVVTCSPRIFKCSVKGCPFASEYSHHLTYHKKQHSVEKSIRCSLCQYSCSTNTMLKSHLRTHEGIMRYRCDSCNFATKQPSALSQHLAHTGHTAGPVLASSGDIPDDENERDFKNHIRAKRRTCATMDLGHRSVKSIKLEKQSDTPDDAETGSSGDREGWKAGLMMMERARPHVIREPIVMLERLTDYRLMKTVPLD